MEAVLAKLADSTRRVYASGWKQWALYNASSGTHPFLDGEERSARTEDEQRLIRFVVFLRQVMGRSIGGVRQRLSAIRYAHVAAGYPNPLVGRPRLWAAVKLRVYNVGKAPQNESSLLPPTCCDGWSST